MRRKVVELRSRGRTVGEISRIVGRTPRRIKQILAAERRDWEARQEAS